MVTKSWSQLSESQFSFGDVRYQYWVLAVLSYCSAMFLASVFWHRVLWALGQQPAFGKSVLAFFASQLGKYVPGKAMVVVIRAGMIKGPKVDTGIAAASVFIETLTWIFVGSTIASLLLVFFFKGYGSLQVTAVGLTLAAGLLTWPPIFQKVAGLVLRKKSQSLKLTGLSFSTMMFGWCVMGLGWCLNGLSLWLVLKGMPGTDLTLSDFPLTLACVSLATVAGFVALLPGGLGVRELVMIPLLGGRFGAATALIAAVIIRFVWLASELIASGIMYLAGRSTPDPNE